MHNSKQFPFIDTAFIEHYIILKQVPTFIKNNKLRKAAAWVFVVHISFFISHNVFNCQYLVFAFISGCEISTKLKLVVQAVKVYFVVKCHYNLESLWHLI